MAKDDIELLSVDIEESNPRDYRKKTKQKKEKKQIDRNEKKAIYKKVSIVLVGIIVLLLLIALVKNIGKDSGLSKEEKEKYSNLYIKVLENDLDIDEGYNISLVDFNNDVIPELIVRYGKYIYRVYTIKDDKVVEIKSFHAEGEVDPKEELGNYQLFYDRDSGEETWFFLYDTVYYDMKGIAEKDMPERVFVFDYDLNKDYVDMESSITYKSIYSENYSEIVQEMMDSKNYEVKINSKAAKKKAKNNGTHKVVCHGGELDIDDYHFYKEYVFIDNQFTEVNYILYFDSSEYNDEELYDIYDNISKGFNYSPSRSGMTEEENNQIALYYRYYKDDYCKNFDGDCGGVRFNFDDVDDMIQDIKGGTTCEIE